MLKKHAEFRIGDRLREVRERKGITLRQIAEKASLSESLISQIERNKVSPSIETLLVIAEILDLDMDYLFRDYRKKRRVSIVHPNERNRIIIDNVLFEQLSILQENGDEHAIEAFLLELPPGSEKGSSDYGHAGKEMGFVLEGEGEVRYGAETHLIGKGDSITFSSDSPHILKNTGTVPLRALWMITPPKMFFGRD